jgi:hypothetical protein
MIFPADGALFHFFSLRDFVRPYSVDCRWASYSKYWTKDPSPVTNMRQEAFTSIVVLVLKSGMFLSLSFCVQLLADFVASNEHRPWNNAAI